MGAWLSVLAALGRACAHTRLDGPAFARPLNVEVWQNERGEWYVEVSVRVLCNEHDDPCVFA